MEKQEHYGASDANNLLIQGDNLIVLRALLPFYKGKVKCIYIDPPYNTGSAFELYDDKLEHSQWLSMMMPRLQLLREFLSEDGSIWVSIDNKESHYLKVLLDEVFGRNNFVTEIAWQQRTTRENRKAFSENHESILIFSKKIDGFVQSRNSLPMTSEIKERYKNPDNDPRGEWQSVAMTAQAGHATPNQFYEITTPGGRVLNPPSGRCWLYTEEKFRSMLQDNRIYFGASGNNAPRVKKFFTEMEQGVTPDTLWLASVAGTNDFAKKHSVTMFGSHPFDNPKPESLIERILTIATNPGDLVLDSFLGSGTTAAVAHKMGRRYIGIEMGEHAQTHCIPRLQMVIEGEAGGISESVNWHGGGGFDFYTLGEPVFDEFGLINPQVKFETLAAYLWQSETGEPSQPEKSPFLGEHNGFGIYLLFSDVLGSDENVLNYQRLKMLLSQYPFDGEKIIYADACSGISDIELKRLHVTFKQIPFDIRQ